MDQTDFDFTDTPDDLLLPDMFYNFEITNVQEQEAHSNKTMCNLCNMPRGKKMLVVTFTVIEPVDYKGSQLFDRFVIGIDTDPCAHSPQTLTGRVFGAINFKHLLQTTGTPTNQYKTIVGKRCQRATTTRTYDASDGKRTTNDLARGVYPIGTVPIGQPFDSQSGSNRPAASQPPKRMVPCSKCHEEFPEDIIDDHYPDCVASQFK